MFELHKTNVPLFWEELARMTCFGSRTSALKKLLWLALNAPSSPTRPLYFLMDIGTCFLSGCIECFLESAMSAVRGSFPIQ
eukprot:scaffold114903_cov19-Tisochrysis_lutea.AAC.1